LLPHDLLKNEPIIKALEESCFLSGFLAEDEIEQEELVNYM
jgi:hypothetical protein